MSDEKKQEWVPLSAGPSGEVFSEEATQKLISLLASSPPEYGVFIAGILPIIEALHNDKIFLKAVIAKHEKNIRELAERYGIKLPPPVDPKSLYSRIAADTPAKEKRTPAITRSGNSG